MSKQKLFAIVGAAVLVVLVIILFVFVGKYNAIVPQLADAQAKLSEATVDLNDANAAIAEAQTALEAAEAQVTELTAAKEAAEQSATDLTASQEASGQQIAELTTAKETAEQQIAELTAAKETAEQQIAELTAAKETAEQQIAELTAAKETAEQQTAALELSGKESADALLAEQTAHNAVKAQLDSINAKLAETEASLAGALADLTEKSEENTLLTDELADAVAKLELSSSDKEKIEEALSKLKIDLEAETAKNAEILTTVEGYKAQIAELTAKTPVQLYECKCGISFVLPEGMTISNETASMVEILVGEDARIKLQKAAGRISVFWYDADIESVNQLLATLQFK